MRLLRAVSLVLAASAVGVVACADHVYTGNEDQGVTASTFDRDSALDDASFVASQEFSEDDIQRFFERTPWNTRSGLADLKEGEERASSILLRIAIVHKVNPLELLVRLQMERGLVQKTIASEGDVSLAFNCGCPDGLACDDNPDQYMGFFNQADCTAKVFRQNFDLAETTSTLNGWKRNEAHTSEDSLTVTPKTRATCVLYNYTPYVGEGGGGKMGISGVSGYVEIRARFRSALRGEYFSGDGGVDANASADTGAPTTDPDAGLSACAPSCVKPNAVCDTSGDGPKCVQCIADPDCTSGLCNPDTKTCVECTRIRTERCVATRTGTACLDDNTCGCGDDSMCGTLTSGRVCDKTKRKCTIGCRPLTSVAAADGNQCPAGQTCLVIVGTNPDIGSCVRSTGTDGGARRPDAGSPGDRIDPPRPTPTSNGAPPLPHASAPGTQTKGGGEENVELGNGPDKTKRIGPSCSSASSSRPADAAWLALAALGSVFVRRRNRQPR